MLNETDQPLRVSSHAQPSNGKEQADPSAATSSTSNAASLPPTDASFDDPEVFQTFVASLYASLGSKLDAPLDPDVATEVASLNRLLALTPRRILQENREFLKLAFRLLGEERPDLQIVAGIRRDIWELNERQVGGLSSLLARISGRTLFNAVIMGLLTVLLASFATLFIMGGGTRLLLVMSAGSGGMEERLMRTLRGSGYTELLIMSHAAILGSIVSIMVRIKTFLADTALTPLETYVSILTRPVVAFMCSCLAFCVMKTGIVSFQSLDLSGPNGYYAAWAMGFFCGFSERLAQNFVVVASRNLGGPVLKDSTSLNVSTQK